MSPEARRATVHGCTEDRSMSSHLLLRVIVEVCQAQGGRGATVSASYDTAYPAEIVKHMETAGEYLLEQARKVREGLRESGNDRQS